jgi:hypothetical protein
MVAVPKESPMIGGLFFFCNSVVSNPGGRGNVSGMSLDETQRKQVAAWIAEGLKIADIQKQMEAQWGLRQTYLEVRLLVDDLKLVPKDPAPPPPPPAATPPAAPPAAGDLPPRDLPPSKVRVTVDQVTRVGAMASGKVKFSDNKAAEWYLDQMGRLALAPTEKGYKPTAADLQDFQMALQNELERMG